MSERDRPTTVRELITFLQQYPADMCVVVEGYEGGYWDASRVEEISIDRNIYSEWYYGPHADAEDVHNGEKVVVVNGGVPQND